MKTSFTGLSTKNLRTLSQRIISTSRLEKHAFVHQNELLQLLENEATAYEAVEGKLSFSGKGKEVKAADEARDKAFLGFKLIINGMQTLSHLGNYSAAIPIANLIQQYGMTLHRLTYAEQTAQLSKLLTALSTIDGIQTKLENLGLTTVFKHLKDTQTNFEVVFAQQINANAELRQMSSATGQRRTLESALRDYLSVVSKMSKINSWKALYAELNEIVKASIQNNRSSKDHTHSPAED